MFKKLEEEVEPEGPNKKEESGEVALSQIFGMSEQEPELRTLTIIGEINEELSKDVMAALWYLENNAKIKELVNPEDPNCEETKEVIQPIEIVISTNGGSADDMFAIYDAIRWVRKTIDVETYGLGKVMSAGTLILAAGTKGKRYLSSHCRVMMHSVNGGHVGELHNLQNEMEQMAGLQDSYIQAMSCETSMTKKQLQSLINKKINIYLDAEETIAKGLADEVWNG